MLNKPEQFIYLFIHFHFFILQSSHLFLWRHTLNQIHEILTRNGFPIVLKKFPEVLSTCWLLCLHSAVQLIPNHLSWVTVRWWWRPGHLSLRSITLLPGGVLWVTVLLEKQIMVLLSAKRMGRHVITECCGSHCWSSVPWIFNKSTKMSPAKHPYITSLSMLHGRNHTYRNPSLTFFMSHKNLIFGLIRTKNRFPLV